MSKLRRDYEFLKKELKRIQDRQEELADWLNMKAAISNKCSNDWKRAGDKNQAAYQSGEWFAYNNAQKFLHGDHWS